MSDRDQAPDPRHSAKDTRLSRRKLLTGVSAASVFSLLSACEQLSAQSGSRRRDRPSRSALLLPLSGASAELGQTLQSAATLSGGPGIGIEIVDSGSTPETAVTAAERAVKAGAEIIVGPVFGAQASAVGKALRVPIVTLSNDEALAGDRIFVFGVTATQSARAVLSIAAQRGLRTVATVVPLGAFGAQSAAAATTVGAILGLSMQPTMVRGNTTGLVDALRSNGPLPDAVYLPVVDATLEPFAEELSNEGVQLLGSTQWSALDLSGRRAFRGAWFAAPDPLRFAAFDDAFMKATGKPGGIISGLAFDGVELLRILGQTGQLTTRGLTRDEGFIGVLGPYRFKSSGLCERGLGVLSVGTGEFSLIGSTSV